MAKIKLFFFLCARGSPIDLLTRKEMYPLVYITERFLLFGRFSLNLMLASRAPDVDIPRAEVVGVQ